jgi:NAD+ synthase
MSIKKCTLDETKEDILRKYRNVSFNAKTYKDKLVDWIKDWFNENGPDCNAVIGISGGKDSSILAALCVEALGKDRVIGVLMPNGIQSDIQDSLDLVKYLNIKHFVVNIGDTINTLTNSLPTLSNQAKTNLPPRIRMSTLYAISQSNNGRVVNTCNLSETLLGWETRWGDAVGDFAPFANITATEVIAIGLETTLPRHLVVKIPSDGLCGHTDEDAFGFTYKMLDNYIRTGDIDDAVIKIKIDNMIKMNWFKHSPIPAFNP